MLYEIMRYCRNFHVKETHAGTFEIVDGTIDLPYLKTGQYFLIEGSDLNDGVYRYPSTALNDETFTGWIHALAVPPEFLALAEDIEAWCKENNNIICSPYKSESFGGYTYTKDDSASSWIGAFARRLRVWRKV